MSEAERFRYLVLAAQREGNRLLSELLSPLGLTPSQAEVLAVLARQPGLTLQDLGRRLICETGSPSRLVSGLVTAGLVQRRPAAADRRALELSLTAAGAAAATEVAAAERDLYAILEQLLDRGRLAAANAVLEHALANTSAAAALTLRGLATQPPLAPPDPTRPPAP